MINMKIKKLYEDAVIPTRADNGSAGMDLYAYIDNNTVDILVANVLVIPPHKTEMVSVGFAMEIPNGTYGAIFARSGLASKQGLRPANCVGVVDSTYRGEVFVALHNDSDEIKCIHHKDRIAQMIIMEYPTVEITETDVLSDTERGANGFGSSGK
jgi:dUTP pyrophosphatase